VGTKFKLSPILITMMLFARVKVEPNIDAIMLEAWAYREGNREAECRPAQLANPFSEERPTPCGYVQFSKNIH